MLDEKIKLRLAFKHSQSQEENKSELLKISNKIDNLLTMQGNTSPDTEYPAQQQSLEVGQSISYLKSEISTLSTKFDSLLKLLEPKNTENTETSSTELKEVVKVLSKDLTEKLELIAKQKSDTIVMPPNCGHTINKDDSDKVSDTDFNPVVKSKSNEKISAETTHNNFSGDEQTSNMDNIQEQESDWEDIYQETTHPSQKKSKLKWMHSGKYKIKSRRKCQKLDEEEEKYNDWLITLILGIFYAISQTSKLLLKNQKQRIVWVLFLMLESRATSTHGATICLTHG